MLNLEQFKTPAWRMACALVVAITAGCQGTDEGPVWNPPAAALARDLTPDRPAGPGTAVVIGVSPGSRADVVRVPYRFEDSLPLHQCIQADDVRILAASLESADGEVVWQQQRGQACPDAVTLPAGRYTLMLSHADAPSGFTIFLSPAAAQPMTSRPVSAANGVPGALPDTEPGEYVFLTAGDSTLESAEFSPPPPGRPPRRELFGNTGSWHYSQLWALRTDGSGPSARQRLVERQRNSNQSAWSVCGDGHGDAFLQVDDHCDFTLKISDSQPLASSPAMRSTGGNKAQYCYELEDGNGQAPSRHCLTARGRIEFAGAARNEDAVFTLNPRYRVDAASYQPKAGEVVLSVPLAGEYNQLNTEGLVFNASSRLRLPYGTRVSRVRTGPNTMASISPGTWLTGDTSIYSWQAQSGWVNVTTSMDLLASSASCRRCDLSGLDLSGLNLNSVDLTEASMTGIRAEGTRFQGARLAGADFSNAVLKGAVFGGVAVDVPKPVLLNGTVFDGADLAGADFSQAALGCVSMRGTRLTGTRLDGARLQGVDFSGATLNQASLQGISLPGENLQQMPAPDESPCGAYRFLFAAPAEADSSGNFADVPVRGLRLEGTKVWTDAPPLELWREIDMSGAQIAPPPGKTIADVGLAGADLHGGRYRSVNFTGLDLRGVNFDDADLTGAQLNSSQLSVLSRGGTAQPATFRRAILRGANLNDANAKQADFTGATLNADTTAASTTPQSRAASAVRMFAPLSVFNGADLTGADFSGAQLYGPGARMKVTATRARFIGATLNDIDLGGSRLQGADFSGANLINAKLSTAVFGTADNGAVTTFTNAVMQGAQMGGIDDGSANFSGVTVSLTAGSLRVRREMQPGLFVQDWLVRFPATSLPNTGPATTCPRGGQGQCLDWSIPQPQQPSCVPTQDAPCSPDYRAQSTDPFIDFGAEGSP